MNARALQDSGLNTKQIDRSKNFFALGLIYWLYDRSIEPTLLWIEATFSIKPEVATATTDTGLALKSGARGLAVIVELPIVVAMAQRSGPSTGMPTKTEQADLLQAMFGRNGECLFFFKQKTAYEI